MPDGLTDTLTRGELLDLVRFLSELGKVGPYAVDKSRVVRRWQVLEATPSARQVLEQTGLAAAARPNGALPWSPAYSTVAGVLPLDAVPPMQLHRYFSDGTHRRGFVRCQLDVTAAGPVKLRLNSAAGLSLWLDETLVEVRNEMMLDLKPGTRRLTFAVDLSQRKDELRCELNDVPGSPARVRIGARR